MGEERIPTGFELARENARVMLERTSPSDPTAQAMESVAENVNKMDLATRDLLGKLTKRLGDLANQASASSSEQAKVLEGLAKDAADEFGKVYASAGGITGEDIEKLSRELAETVAAEVPAGVEREAEAVRELTEEFASRITEAMEESTSAVEEAVMGTRPPRPGEVPPEVSVEKRERREEMKENLEREEGLFTALGERIVGGSSNTAKWVLDKVLVSLGYIVGGVLAFRTEIKEGLKRVWEEAKAGWEWFKDHWTEIPGIVYRNVKKGLEWLWEQMVAIKDWMKDAIKGFPAAAAEFAATRGKQLLGIDESGGVVGGVKRTLPGRVVGGAAAVLKAVIPGGGVLGKLSDAAAEKLGMDVVARKLGLVEEVEPSRHLGGITKVFPGVVETRPVEPSGEAPTVAAERDLQVRAATTAVVPGRGMPEIEGLIRRGVQLQEAEARRVRFGMWEVPAMFDSIGAPDDVGLTGVAAGLVSGGFQF